MKLKLLKSNPKSGLTRYFFHQLSYYSLIERSLIKYIDRE